MAAEPKMITLTIDGHQVTVPEGTLVLDAARKLGINIPIFCSHHRLKPLGACRICLVEKEKAPKPVIACAEVATEGAVIHTQSDVALKARTGIMEYLLANHPLDCPICDEGGECDLQDTSYEHGISESRFLEMKRHFETPVDLGPIVVLDRNRCIVCARCVRYCADIMGDTALAMEERGFSSMINSKDGGPLECEQCGNCIEVCPVGALTSRPYRFKARPWDLKQTETVCNYCSNGCTFHLGRMNRNVLRARAKRSHGVNRDFLCVRGRYGYEFVSSADRLTFPRLRREGALARVEWSEALEASVQAIQVARQAGKAVAGLASARLGNESLYLFQRLMREVIGSPHLDHRLEERAPLSGDTLRKLSAFEVPPVTSIQEAGAVLVFGEDLSEEQPLFGTSVLREINYRGLPTVVAHSRRVRLLGAASAPLLYRSGDELAAARGLLKALAAHPGASEAHREGAGRLAERWTWDSIAQATGLPQATFDQAAASFLGAAGPRLLFFGSKVLRSPDAEALVAALINLALLTGASLVPLWSRANSQGALDMGVVPDLGPGYLEQGSSGWNTSQILAHTAAGEVGVLVLAGANPLAHFPDRRLAEAALRKVDFVVALELFDTEATAVAHAVLPACSYAEVDGSVTSSERRVQALRVAVAPVGDALPDWRIFQRLAEGLGASWTYPDMRALQQEIRARVPLYRDLGRRVGPAAPAWSSSGAALPSLQPVADGRPAPPPPPGTLRVESGNVIFHHGTLTRHDPVLVDLLPAPTLYLDPQDAEPLGLAENDMARLEGAATKLEVRIKLHGPAAPGVAFFPDHFVGAEANRLFGPEHAYADLKLVPLGAPVQA